MNSVTQEQDEICQSCVYYPLNLPPAAYSTEDLAMLLEKNCSFDFEPGSHKCLETRKTSCTLVDLEAPDQTP